MAQKNYSVLPHQVNLRRIMNILKGSRSNPKKIEIKPGSLILDGEELTFSSSSAAAPIHYVDLGELGTPPYNNPWTASPQPAPTRRRGSWCIRVRRAVLQGESAPFQLRWAEANWGSHLNRCRYCTDLQNTHRIALTRTRNNVSGVNIYSLVRRGSQIVQPARVTPLTEGDIERLNASPALREALDYASAAPQPSESPPEYDIPEDESEDEDRLVPERGYNP